MTPKEKAEELFDIMLYNDGDKYHHCSHYVGKNCALIAVDEIIEALKNNAANSTSWLYYEQVKNEIEKL